MVCCWGISSAVVGSVLSPGFFHERRLIVRADSLYRLRLLQRAGDLLLQGLFVLGLSGPARPVGGPPGLGGRNALPCLLRVVHRQVKVRDFGPFSLAGVNVPLRHPVHNHRGRVQVLLALGSSLRAGPVLDGFGDADDRDAEGGQQQKQEHHREDDARANTAENQLEQHGHKAGHQTAGGHFFAGGV